MKKIQHKFIFQNSACEFYSYSLCIYNVRIQPVIKEVLLKEKFILTLDQIWAGESICICGGLMAVISKQIWKKRKNNFNFWEKSQN